MTALRAKSRFPTCKNQAQQAGAAQHGWAPGNRQSVIPEHLRKASAKLPLVNATEVTKLSSGATGTELVFRTKPWQSLSHINATPCLKGTIETLHSCPALCFAGKEKLRSGHHVSKLDAVVCRPVSLRVKLSFLLLDRLMETRNAAFFFVLRVEAVAP